MAIVTPQPDAAALVTGASSGIGAELARQLAARGHDLVLVARRRQLLEALADELRAGHGVRAEVIVCDVSELDERERLTARVAELGLAVNVLVLCAGFGMGGPFIAQDPARLRLMMRTNLESTVALAHAFTPAMAARGRGSVLIVSSMAGNQPMPNFAVYSATKSAVTSFAESLHEELRGNGVTVTALCPGSVSTDFAQLADMAHTERRVPRALIASAADTARAGLGALEQGRRVLVPGWGPRALTFTGGHVPRALWLRAGRKLMA
jgi:short-subunit dehydrogenase